jgi:hypothetical protein
MADAKKTPSVHGINAQDFSAWKHHPVTKALHRYLEDYRDVMRRDHLDRWEGGRTVDEHENIARGRVLAAGEFKDLSFDDVLAFYAEPDAEDQTAEGTDGDSST